MTTKNVSLKIKKLSHFDESLALPSYETNGAAGADLRVSLEDRGVLEVLPGQRVLVPTGLSFEIPVGFEVQIRPRSGLSLKTNLLVVNAPGTIDSDYRGEVMVIIGNFGQETHQIGHGERIAQMVISPIWQANFELSESLSETHRGAGGFGSTGTK